MSLGKYSTLLALVVVVVPGAAWGVEPLSLSRTRTHLRSGGVPEWEVFADQPPAGRRLDLRFTAETNPAESTLFIRQDDVRQDWWVELNGKRLGKLFLMEADLVHTLTVPARTLTNGMNVLSILPPRDNDDILLHEIRLDPRPQDEALQEAKLVVRIRDAADGKTMPGRITVMDAQGALAPLAASTATNMAVRPGVAYVGAGEHSLAMPAGEYTVFASRGFEWSVATQHVQLARGGSAELNLSLQRTVKTPGWVSADTHVHTLTHSGHGDATVEERMLTLAGEGLEMPVATEHNLNIDYASQARRAGVAAWFTPVAGNEVTTPAGHFNIFPVDPAAPPPDFRLTDWPRLMTALRASPRVRVVVLNHPRNVHNNFQPFAATNFNAVSGENRRGPEFTFDALELVNSSAQQSDFMLVYRDWFALLNHGYRITAVGSSDGHDVSRYIVGQGRTYIACPDGRTDEIDVLTACSNLLAGRALVSMGLLVEMTINGQYRVGDMAKNLGPELRVDVRVQAPPWISAANVGLFANGVKVREQALTSLGDQTVTWTLPRPLHDAHLVAIASGPGVTAPYWGIPRPYQPASPHWESRVIGSTNPIWVDGDGDGQFTAPRAYARRLAAQHSANPLTLIPALASFDEAVAAQAASLCVAAGHSIASPETQVALKSAAPPVQRGFATFAETLR
jgi:hypothetical protein